MIKKILFIILITPFQVKAAHNITGNDQDSSQRHTYNKKAKPKKSCLKKKTQIDTSSSEYSDDEHALRKPCNHNRFILPSKKSRN